MAFTRFAIYQVASLLIAISHSWPQSPFSVTILDIIVVLLIIAEYRHVRLARKHNL